MKTLLFKQVTIVLMTTLIIACGGDKTFNDYARAGDTIAVAGGYQPNFNLNNISVDIIQGVLNNVVLTYPQGDPAIRASVNFYPDPLSGLIVSRETGIELTPFANTYFQTISSNFTNNDKDWYQTTVFIDLPPTLATTGSHKIRVKNDQGEQFDSIVNIIATSGGSPSTFTSDGGNDLNPNMIAGISRMPHHTVDFSGTTVPHAIELTLTHDLADGVSSKAFAVNPIGYKKNLAWTDDGTTMKVILTPSASTTPDNIIDYKFYVTGGINNLAVSSVTAFDINGNDITGVAGVTAASTFRN